MLNDKPRSAKQLEAVLTDSESDWLTCHSARFREHRILTCLDSVQENPTLLELWAHTKLDQEETPMVTYAIVHRMMRSGTVQYWWDSVDSRRMGARIEMTDAGRQALAAFDAEADQYGQVN